MAIVASTDQERTLLRSSRTGVGLLNAMFAEMYCAELANRNEWFHHKVSILIIAVLSTAATAAVTQIAAPTVAPYYAVASAVLSTVGSVFRWRTRTLLFIKVSRAYGDLVVDWTELWESFRMTQTPNRTLLGNLERRSNEIVESIAPVPMEARLGRELQGRVRARVGLIVNVQKPPTPNPGPDPDQKGPIDPPEPW